MKGRKRKPTYLKLIEGNRGKRALNKREPKPPRGIPSPPEHVSKSAALAWGIVSVKLDQMGVLTLADSWALEQIAENYAEIMALRKIVKKSRFQTVITTNGSKKKVHHPAWVQLSDAEKRFRMMMEQFGLTPASRSKVNAEPPDEGEKDPAAKYFS